MADDLTDAEYDAREQRLKADVEDARQTLNRARANFDRISDELRDLRIVRRKARREQQ